MYGSTATAYVVDRRALETQHGAEMSASDLARNGLEAPRRRHVDEGLAVVLLDVARGDHLRVECIRRRVDMLGFHCAFRRHEDELRRRGHLTHE